MTASTATAASDRAFIDGLSRFISDSPSSFHAVAAAAKILDEAGFTRLDENAPWPSATGRHYIVRDGAIVAWDAPQTPKVAGFRIIGAHTDSPGFHVKPAPTFTQAGWQQLAVEVYGGPLLHTWFDRDLCVAGRLIDRLGRVFLVQSDPIARIASLAIHLDRDLATGITIDRQRHTQPILATGLGGSEELVQNLASSAGIARQDVAGFDLGLADTQAPALIGQAGDLFAAGRLDNLSSAYAALRALTASEVSAGEHARVVALFDHEEVGSETYSGAAGPVLASTLRRVAAGLSEDEFQAALAASLCVSADAGHGVHPNWPEKHDPTQWPNLGAGPMLKVNANQRYATDGVGAALWRHWCDLAGVRTQTFVSNNSIPCGSTIGPITATRLGVRTIDVGVPLLSMHSVRELAHAGDLRGLADVLGQFLAVGHGRA